MTTALVLDCVVLVGEWVAEPQVAVNIECAPYRLVRGARPLIRSHEPGGTPRPAFARGIAGGSVLDGRIGWRACPSFALDQVNGMSIEGRLSESQQGGDPRGAELKGLCRG